MWISKENRFKILTSLFLCAALLIVPAPSPSASQESNNAQLQREVAIIAPIDPESDESAERMELPKENSDAQKIYYTDEDRKFNSISERPESPLIAIPSTYDSRQVGRVSSVKDQGTLGTCWAFAALGAMESLLMPQEVYDFSEDHLSLNHGYALDQTTGGDYSIALASLAAWKGPVAESDDPYGDHETNPHAKVLKHLQEAIILDGNVPGIKEAVMKYGAVQSSVFSPNLEYIQGVSPFYNASTYGFYYNGQENTNHDILIVGWDDAYSKSNFSLEPEGDGAFICKNSWGESFGDGGYYYVSYYDKHIGNKAIAYTRLDDIGVYDSIYQYDELGWVGQIGYRKPSAHIANIFVANSNEVLEAVSFYTLGENTDYAVYVAVNPLGTDFHGKVQVASGTIQNKGYHTIDLAHEISLQAGESFAIIVEINTPGSSTPIAAEFEDDGVWAKDVKVGINESFMSYDGSIWMDVGESLGCNICLKAFTKQK